jgi:hypothetical protein
LGKGLVARQGGAIKTNLASGPKVLAVCPNQFSGFRGFAQEDRKIV